MSKFYNISTDNTLGGSSASNSIVSSQKAIKEYVDSQTGTAPSFSNIIGQPTDNANLATALNAKQDILTAGTDLEIVSISHNLPAEYQELRYIQGVADTQYIDTGIVPTSSMNMYGKFMMVNRSSSNVAFFGARESNAYSGVYAWTTTSQVKAQWFLTADAQRLTINDSAQIFNTYEYYFENNTCIIKKNGREIGYKAFTPQGSITKTLYVNALNNNNSVGSNNGATVRIYRFTIENECDLIPAKRISDSKIGMYDIIRNQFLTNAGSDDFTAGSDIIGSGLEINFTNDSGYITDITSSDVTTALGYTPADNSGIVHTAGAETVGGVKTFTDVIKRTDAFSENATTLIKAEDSNGKGESRIDTYYQSSKIRTRLLSQNDTSNTEAYLEVKAADDGTVETYAPACGTTSNSILTHVAGGSVANPAYMKLGNGVLIQWGSTSNPSSSITVTLGTAFSNTSYRVFASASGTNASIYAPSIDYTSSTTSKFVMKLSGGAASVNHRWFAIGWWS